MLELREEYVRRFAAFPAVRTSEPHDGEFRESEVHRLGASAPAVYVACIALAAVGDADGDELEGILSWVAMIVTRPEDGVREGQRSHGDVAALIALRIVYELERGECFEAATEPAEKVRARNAFATSTAKSGFVLWAVTWRQTTVITPADLEAALAPLRTVHTDFELSSEDGVEMSGTATLPIDRDMSGEATAGSTATGELELS